MRKIAQRKTLLDEKFCLGYQALRSCGFGKGGRGFGAGVAFEVAGVLGVGVVAPFAWAGVLVVPDGERGDLGFQVVAGGELAAAQQPAGKYPEPLLVG